MAKPKKEWPLAKYNPGPAKHLHALGVIATRFTAFERGMYDLYLIAFFNQTIPRSLIDLIYSSQNEENRYRIILPTFREFEKDPRVLTRVENVIDYFEWCKSARNAIVHSELYPASIFADRENTLHLTKRKSKKDPKSQYLSLSINEIRAVADKIQKGVQHCANIRIYLRYRHRPPAKLPLALRTELSLLRQQRLTLPRKLAIPKALAISDNPHQTHRVPPYLRQTSSD